MDRSFSNSLVMTFTLLRFSSQMAKHEVKMTIPPRDLNREQLEFAVRIDDKPFGRLRVSNGSIVWVEGKDTYGYKISWTKLSELIIANGAKEK